MLPRLVSLLRVLAAAALVSVPAAARADDDFKPPTDGLVTERQMTGWIAVTKDLVKMLEQEGKLVEGSKTPVGTIAAAGRMDARRKKALADQGLTDREFDWIAREVSGLYFIVEADVAWEKSEVPAIQAKEKQVEQDIADAKARAAAAEAALKDGKRILAPEAREAEVARAKENAASADEDAKGRTDEADAAAKEAKEDEQKASEAEKAAKSPEGDDDDAKKAFADGKKAEAADARDAAKEARGREAEARKAAADARARGDLWRKHAETPEIPVEDDAKEQAKSENEAAIREAKERIPALEEQLAYTREAEKSGNNGLDGERAKHPKANYDLVMKHRREIREAFRAPTPDYDK
jgi:hypothetical protein